MPRKPLPGGDRNSWGLVLNEYLGRAHNPDGTIKPSGVVDAVADALETSLAIQLPQAAAAAVAAEPTVTAAAAAAIDAEPRISTITGDVSTLKLGVATTNIRTLGLALNGTTDETAAFQAVIDNASNGDVLVLDERAKLRISDQIAWSGKRLTLNGFGDAEIESTAVLSTPLINISHSPNGSVSGLKITGAETSFTNAIDPQNYAVRVNASDDFTVGDLRIGNVTRGVQVASSKRPVIDNVFFQGMATGHSLNVNYHTTLNITSSEFAKISRVHGQDCGSAVLVGAGSSYGAASMVSGRNTYDNGVYISSGTDWEVTSPVFVVDPAYTGNIGTGVKMRGSRHTLMGGHFERMGIGATISGAGADEGDGTNGGGSRVIGATARDCAWMGFMLDDISGLSYKDAVIALNSAIGCGWAADASTMASIRALMGINTQILYNTVRSNKVTTYAMIVGGPVYGALHPSVVGNQFRSTFGRGLLVDSATGGLVSDNLVHGIGSDFGMLVQNSSGLEVRGNRGAGAKGSVAGIRLQSSASNCRVIDNPTLSVSDTGTGTLRSGNDGSVSANIAVAGSRGGNAALTSLISQLAALGIVRDVTTA